MYPKRKYIVVYKHSEIVEATSSWEARKAFLKNHNDEDGNEFDVLEEYETFKDYEIDLPSGKTIVRAEYHRDTVIMPHSNGEDPSGYYKYRDNGHLIYVLSDDANPSTIEAIFNQIGTQEDELGNHAHYNALRQTLINARHELEPALKIEPNNICYTCKGAAHKVDCPEENRKYPGPCWQGCCVTCNGRGNLQMFIGDLFEPWLKNDLVSCWWLLYNSGRCHETTKTFWKLMSDFALFFDDEKIKAEMLKAKEVLKL